MLVKVCRSCFWFIQFLIDILQEVSVTNRSTNFAGKIIIQVSEMIESCWKNKYLIQCKTIINYLRITNN